jgi:hypothetical protein
MLLLVLILVLLVGWLFLRSRQDRAPVARKTLRRVTTTKKNYHAVSIKFAAYACSAAKELDGQRFLSNVAPRLPLPECDVTDCKCHFAHHKDRRVGKDRRNVFTASGYSAETGKHEQERRHATERRHDDDDDFIY